MAQIVVDLLGNDRLSPVLQESIRQIDGYNAAVDRMKSPAQKTSMADFKAANRELAQVLQERKQILERGSMDWQRGQLTPTERAQRQEAQRLADQAQAKSKVDNQYSADSMAEYLRSQGYGRSQEQIKAERAVHETTMRGLREQRAMREQIWKDEQFNAARASRQQIDGVGTIKRRSIGDWQAQAVEQRSKLPQTVADMDRLNASAQKFQLVGMQAAFAVDDFMAGFSTGGVAGGLRGAANNISMIGMQLGGLKGLLIGIGVAATASLAFKAWDHFTGGAEKAKQSVEGVRKELDKLREQQIQIDAPMARPKTLDELRRASEKMDPEAIRSQMMEVQFEGTQRARNQLDYDANAKLFKDRQIEQNRRLTAELFDPYAVSENAFRLGTVDQQQAKLRDPRLTDEQRDKLRQLIDLTKELNSAEKESADNLSRTNALRLERQALRDSLPVAEKRVADEAAEQAQKEQEQQTRQQSQLERKLQAEQRRQQGQVDRRADKQGRLDAILAGENDPAEAILMEMKSRLETANSITSEPMRATMVGMIRKSAVEKLAAEELRGQPQESSERRLGGTYLRGSAEAYRTIQTATAQARETPEAKHLKAIERISKDQLDSLTELVDLFSRDPIQVVGP